MRKGQNLAVESVATFGLTLVAAIGVVQIFGNVNNDVVSSAQDTQASIVADRVRSAVLQMSYSSEGARGHQQLDLPEEIGGKNYRIALENSRVIVFTENENYRQNFNLAKPEVNMRGSAEGGNVRVFKNSEGYVLRSGR